MKALDGMGKLDDPFFGTVEPDASVEITFNLSQGNDFRGPWNSSPLKYESDPQPKGGMPVAVVNPDDEKATVAGEKKVKEPA
jgi:Mn-containing catalase